MTLAGGRPMPNSKASTRPGGCSTILPTPQKTLHPPTHAPWSSPGFSHALPRPAPHPLQPSPCPCLMIPPLSTPRAPLPPPAVNSAYRYTDSATKTNYYLECLKV